MVLATSSTSQHAVTNTQTDRGELLAADVQEEHQEGPCDVVCWLSTLTSHGNMHAFDVQTCMVFLLCLP